MTYIGNPETAYESHENVYIDDVNSRSSESKSVWKEEQSHPKNFLCL